MPSITIGSVVIGGWHGPTTVELRIFADREFKASDGTIVQPGGVPNIGNWSTFTCTVVGTNITIASGSLYSTRDSDEPGTRYGAYFFNTATGAMIQAFEGFDQFQLSNNPSPATWQDIRLFNRAAIPIPIDNTTFNRDTIMYLLANVGTVMTGVIAITQGGTGGTTASEARSNLGLGTISTQNSNAVAITGGTISGVTISSSTFPSPTLSGATITGSTISSSTVGATSLTTSNATITGGSITGTSITTSNATISGGSITGITDLAVADGGTGSSTAAGARTNLSAAALGANTDITSLAGINTQAGIVMLPYGTSSGNTSEIRFRGLAANGTNYIALKGTDSNSTDYTIILPNNTPSTGQMLTASTISGSGPYTITSTWTSPPGMGSGYNTISINSNNLTARTTLNFLDTIASPDFTSGPFAGKDNGSVTHIALIPDSIIERVIAYQGSVATPIGGAGGAGRPAINFTSSGGASVTVTDNPGLNAIDVNVNAGAGGGGVGGSGTTNKVSKFTSSSSIGDSTITDTGSAITLGSNTSVTGTFGVSGATTLSSTLSAGATTLASGSITGALTVGTTLGVTGATTLSTLSATTGSFSSTLGVSGATTLSSTLAAGSTTITGTLSVSSTSQHTGNATFAAQIISSLATGTAPLSISSTTPVSNLTLAADTQLPTISTSGKVSNSATTATSANTNSAIVARDGSGNFSAGTITATLSGNASTATSATNATNATNLTGNLTGDVTSTGMVTSYSATVPATKGGTAQTSYTTGDTLYASATNTLSKLAGNATASRQFLSMTSSAPSWVALVANDIPNLENLNGTLTVAKGGTGATSASAARSNLSAAASGANSDITSLSGSFTAALTVNQGGTGLLATTPYALLAGGTTSTANLQQVASLGTAGQVLTSNGAGALPTFQNASGGGGAVSSVSVASLNTLITASPTTGDVVLNIPTYSDNRQPLAIPGVIYGGTGVTINATNLLNYYAVYIPFKAQFTKMSCTATGSVSGSANMQVGVYTIDGSSRLVLGTIVVSAGVFGIRSTATALTGNATYVSTGTATLPPGWYMVAYALSGTTGFLFYGDSLVASTAALMGVNGTLGTIASGATGGTLPSSFTPNGSAPSGATPILQLLFHN